MREIRMTGPVGASDLVRSAQLSAWILAHPKAEGHGLSKAKDALAMIDSDALSLAEAPRCIVALHHLMRGFDPAAAMAIEGIRANFDAIGLTVSRVNRRAGKSRVAGRIRGFLDASSLNTPGAARFPQDPLSYRNVSQIHGAAGDWLD